MDEILNDKLFCEDVIKKSYFNNKKVAEGIGAKYKEFAVKYHPDRKKNYQYPNPPYIKQLWHLAVGAKEVLHDADNIPFFSKHVQTYEDPKNWDRIENKEHLGRVDIRIQKVREFEKKSIEERIALVPFILQEQLKMKQNSLTQKSKEPSKKMNQENRENGQKNRNGKVERCDSGTRRNKKTGRCESKQKNGMDGRQKRERQERERQEKERQERERQERERQERERQERERQERERQERERQERERQERERQHHRENNDKVGRCKKGTQRNKKTGDCEPTRMRNNDINEGQKNNSSKVERCNKGTRRNKKTGACEPK
jgi:hypothetical protein